ncbi:RNA polymerase subunit sigma-70 [Micromonospora chalcea]|uniref:RNA polymerase subunit sigma-70 n=1 Tax=Micromonospora TaxID=1873 RepID=UPI001AE17E34|nr:MULTISPECIES: RNA polymerase subunit sigma-70 [unclassified Micromonospora]MBP1784971.1 RNA polymerase sigma-70 factor (ECF subfamily) [Micromonospora sp. HB375]MDH6470574.1 RNA polymerase sigma-70 factor (TIGR02960 family) [Micromonospora sp. H404/HB375]
MSDSPDEQAVWLQRAFDEHQRELHVHCYRLAGNVTDADDLVQETFLRAWRARDRFEGRASARTWLYRIATNVFLDSRKAAGHRTVPYGDPLEWSTELGPYPDALLADDAQAGLAARETVELAVIAALMYLPPRQRAAFVLRDVHGWTPQEIAVALDTAVAAVNSLLQRARHTLRGRAPSDPKDWRRPQLTSEDEEILRRYADAKDPETIRELLAEDVRITMPPEPPVVGIDAAAEFLGRPLDWRTFPTSANGRPALINYLRRPGSRHYEALVVDVLRIENGKIVESNAFIGARHVAAFGMPTTLEA